MFASFQSGTTKQIGEILETSLWSCVMHVLSCAGGNLWIFSADPGLDWLFAGVGLKAHWDIFMDTKLQPNNKSGLTWLDSDALDLLHLKPDASHHFCVSMAMEGDAVQTPWQQQIMWNKIWAPYCARTCVCVCGLHLTFLLWIPEIIILKQFSTK